MAKGKGEKEKKGGSEKTSGSETHRVGRPLQARLIAVEKKIGLFSQEQAFDADSRFNHPVILPAEARIPPGMIEVFAEELAEVQRLGNASGTCHRIDFRPYRVFCLSHFNYDGFRALLYVERNGALVAAWKEEEVAQPDSPRTLISGQSFAQVDAFLDSALAG